MYSPLMRGSRHTPLMICSEERSFFSAKVSSSLKKETRIARYVLEKSLTDSASVEPMTMVGMSSSREQSAKSFTNCSALVLRCSEGMPAMMREGCRLS